MANDKWKTLFSTATGDWATPQPVYDQLNAEFAFTLDPCASATNAKCPRFFTPAEDGLGQDWSKETAFMNPGKRPSHCCIPKKSLEDELPGE